MCHGQAVAAFPEPKLGEPFSGVVEGYAYGDPSAAKKIVILPDIYGCNPFYQGLSQRYADKGARVFLVDTFAGLGELPENTREAAFARRGQVKDKTFLDSLETFCEAEGVTGLMGFCLGGLYVFELARRDVSFDLVGLYGFPQGLPNQDDLPVPFDYLPSVTKKHIMLMGRDDSSVGPDNIAKLEDVAAANPAIQLTVYDPVGHNFLPEIDSEDPTLKAVAIDALEQSDAALL
ncbi:MAG: dienelactone hydrolase family protein [Henriciella sp.]|nr:dienelactone hydrolase family protein [Henriciella sp.]